MREKWRLSQANTEGINHHQTCPAKDVKIILQEHGKLYRSEICDLYHNGHSTVKGINILFLLFLFDLKDRYLFKVLTVIMY